ncbi:helix-turn-helix domain-containing protein [Lacrimispora defluvii]|uniref:Helix-turn-helix transcriptional regulator n=1 Tax=Lacrimispora defluvii TaxID=2719233 RepID=A0ABX1VNV8_9FIRM|nr:helix-turn-helix transcriptional regulator [Lacrimispora defluvii]NNJ30115.1 helix-turn-helix transcriptional regulator [Lacrimispora defluvii]
MRSFVCLLLSFDLVSYNKHGAIFVKLPYGNTLGVKPGEFEFVKAPEPLLKQWKKLEKKEYEKIGKRILKALEIRKMTQRELAEKTGITEATISRYAQSKRVPKGPEIIKIANSLNCTTDFILGVASLVFPGWESYRKHSLDFFRCLDYYFAQYFLLICCASSDPP